MGKRDAGLGIGLVGEVGILYLGAFHGKHYTLHTLESLWQNPPFPMRTIEHLGHSITRFDILQSNATQTWPDTKLTGIGLEYEISNVKAIDG